MNRRSLLKQAGLWAALSALPGVRLLANATNANDEHGKKKKVACRFAHVTDVHMKNELNAPKGLAACLHHLQLQQPAPAFIVSGGDSIFDALKQPRDKVEEQWMLWHNIFRNENSLPIVYCIGNHDCWGLGQKEDPLYGKKFAMAQMRLSAPYRSFNKAGWHFIILDSIQPKPEDGSWYSCYLDEEQFVWLQDDLAATPHNMPVVVISHVPLVSAATVVVDDKVKGGDQGYVLGLASMHVDAARIISLFDKFPNVKLCLSGHIHLYEQVLYNGVTYISNGAVSGNWWKGMRYRTDNGYAMVTLYDDGSFDNEYVTYGWNKA
jgi:3',5'-cyclic AMP phosphodiesterase CpdA